MCRLNPNDLFVQIEVVACLGDGRLGLPAHSKPKSDSLSELSLEAVPRCPPIRNAGPYS